MHMKGIFCYGNKVTNLPQIMSFILHYTILGDGWMINIIKGINLGSLAKKELLLGICSQ